MSVRQQIQEGQPSKKTQKAPVALQAVAKQEIVYQAH
jgi:hypothetical protein